MPDYFQVDLSQTSWRPTSVQDLVDELQRAFEREVAPKDVEFFGIAGPSGKRLLQSDDDVQGFSSEQASTKEADSKEQVDASQDADAAECSTASASVMSPSWSGRSSIKAELPEAISAELRQPKRLSALASGRQIAKWAGEVNTVGIEFSLKVFDCGHFRLKEAYISSGGSSPSKGGGSSPTSPAAGNKGVVSEGRWKEGTEGVQLEFLLRYTCHSRRRSDDSVSYGPPPAEHRVVLLTVDPKDQELLRGALPSSLSLEPVGNISLRREEDVVTKAGKGTVRRGSVPDDDDDDWECREMLKPQVRKPQRPAPPKPRRDWEEDWDSDEPTWPMYLGIFLFIFIFCVFAWVWYDEKYGDNEIKETDEL